MVEISTSLLSVEKEKIIKTIYNLETAKINYFHIDVMDGEFVNNNTVDTMKEYCDYLTNITNIPLDIHLMVNNVIEYVDMFIPYNPNIITFHLEAASNEEELNNIIEYIRSNGCKVGIAIKPNTDIAKLYNIIKKVNLILVMTVEPGQGGQELIKDTISKIDELYKYVKENNLDTLIEADGGINPENIGELKEAGLEIAVVGTSLVNSQNYNQIVNELKK